MCNPYTLEFDKKSCFRMVLKSHRLSFARKNRELRSNIEWYSFEWFVVCPQSSDSSVGFTWCSCLVLILVSLVGFYLSIFSSMSLIVQISWSLPFDSVPLLLLFYSSLKSLAFQGNIWWRVFHQVELIT